MWSWAGVACLVLYLAAAPARPAVQATPLAAHLAARSYERWASPRPLSGDEQLVVQAVAHWGKAIGLRLHYDWRLDRASNTLLPWAQAHAGEALPWDRLQQATWQAGCTDAGLSALALRTATSGLGLQLQKALAQHLVHPQANRFGIARQQDTVVVALSAQRMHLVPTPAVVSPGEHLRLAAQDIDRDIDVVTVALALPDGTLQQMRQTLFNDAFAQVVDVGATGGILEVQVLVERGHGPEVAAQYPVGVGQLPWPPAAANAAVLPIPVLKPTAANAAAELIALVYGVRHAHGLSLPKTQAKLMRAAQSHANDMAQHHFFAHVSPRYGDAAQRLEAIGQPYVRVVETIAAATSIDAAVNQWSRSPSHRARLLDPSVTALGVGIAIGEAPAEVLAVLIMAHLTEDACRGP